MNGEKKTELWLNTSAIPNLLIRCEINRDDL
jgi:hypothetical protein